MIQVKNIQDVPVSVFISVCIIVVFSLYTTSAIKNIPCSNDVISVFMSNFIHTDSFHLVANLYALYALSRVEQAIGGKHFVALIVFLLLLNTALESAINKKFNVPCSIGFSGVLYGIMTWELATQKHLDFYLITAIGATIMAPMLGKTNISVIGHGVGAFSGIIGGLIWNKLGPKLS